jgi:flagellar motor switch protein FliN/FliY
MSETLIPSDIYPPTDAGEGTGDGESRDITFLGDVEVTLSVELGRTTMPVREVLKLRRGSVIELNKLSGQPVEVLVNNTLMARGEVILINGRFGIRLNAFVAKEGA